MSATSRPRSLVLLIERRPVESFLAVFVPLVLALTLLSVATREPEPLLHSAPLFVLVT